MGIRIRIATSTSELEDLFRLRYRVYVDQEGAMPETSSKMIFDRFDAYPDTANVVALDNDRVVGGVRFVAPSVAGTSAEELYDYTRVVQIHGGRIACGSMLCLDRGHRAGSIGDGMLSLGLAWLRSLSVSHVLVCANPNARNFLQRNGWAPIAGETMNDERNLRVLPMSLDFATYQHPLWPFLKEHGLDGTIRDLERRSYRAGETIIRPGGAGDTLFRILSGEVSVRTADGTSIETLGPGGLFGEVEVLAGLRRSSELVALTDVDLIAVSRAQLERAVDGSPALALTVLRSMAERLAGLMDRLEHGAARRARARFPRLHGAGDVT